jgi:hypothetical protein
VNRRHLAALLLAPALALTACGDGKDPEPTGSAQATGRNPSSVPPDAGGGDSSKGGSGTAPRGVPSSAPPKVVNAFVACMRKEGVKVPADVSGWQPDPQDGRTQKALMKCMRSGGAPSS